MMIVSEQEVIDKLRSLTEAVSVRTVAKNIGVKKPYIYAILDGTRPPSEKVLEHLGFRLAEKKRTIERIYEPVK